MIAGPIPKHIKRIVETDMGCDAGGTPYTRVEVVYRWWYRPIAWWNRWRLRPVAGFLDEDETT